MPRVRFDLLLLFCSRGPQLPEKDSAKGCVEPTTGSQSHGLKCALAPRKFPVCIRTYYPNDIYLYVRYIVCVFLFLLLFWFVYLLGRKINFFFSSFILHKSIYIYIFVICTDVWSCNFMWIDNWDENKGDILDFIVDIIVGYYINNW